MDAIEFINEKVRMCNQYDCTDCPLHELNSCNPDSLVNNGNVEKAVKLVEKWSKENPRKTRQNLFLEQYPEANIGVDGVLKACPALISSLYRVNVRQRFSCYGDCIGQCSDCRKSFWNQEIEK